MCIIYIYIHLCKHGCVCVWIDIHVLYIYTFMYVDMYVYSIHYILTDRQIDRQIALNSHGVSPEEKIKAAAEAVKNQTKAIGNGA